MMAFMTPLLLAIPVAWATTAQAAVKQDPDIAGAIAKINAMKDQVTSLRESLSAMVATANANLTTCVRSEIITTTSETTTTTTVPPVGLCAAFGDPHFITFDGAGTTFVGDMTLWIVRTDKIWIQGMSKGSDGKLEGIAIGGDFIQGHTLVFFNSSRGGKYDENLVAFWDDERILLQNETTFLDPDFLLGYRSASWEPEKFNAEILNLTTAANFKVGTFPSRFLGNPHGGLWLFELPNRVTITVSGVDFMSTVIAMPKEAGGASGVYGGYCGNFNGNPDDDALPGPPSWDKALGTDLDKVPDTENLFWHLEEARKIVLDFSGYFDSPGAGLVQVQQKLSECPEALQQAAVSKCSGIEEAHFRQFCIFDVCTTGQLGAADDVANAEALHHVVNARGVPVFMGHGECVDKDGLRFDAYGTGARTDEACMSLLRKLATNTGVLGAQLRRGDSCQVLVTSGVDPTAASILGGWKAHAESMNSKPFSTNGIISNTTSDDAWSCWQVN